MYLINPKNYFVTTNYKIIWRSKNNSPCGENHNRSIKGKVIIVKER